MTRLARLKEQLDLAQTETRKAVDNENQAFAAWDAERIRVTGCKIIGFTVNSCATCGLDEGDIHLCPRQPKEGAA